MTSPLVQTDFYKTNHYKMYPEGTVKIYSNLTPRKSRIPGINEVVVFGIQYFILEYLIKQWNEDFFIVPPVSRASYGAELLAEHRKKILAKYKRLMDHTLGPDSVSVEHIGQLWDLGYMPLHIKALPEGTLCPIGVPCLTITNTVDHAYWLVNYLETILSCTVWQPITSATIAYEYRKLLDKYALETTGSNAFVDWQGHDFSMRGMSSLESACTSGAGHLLSFTGTDTIPAITFLEQYYGANVETELVGASVPATEHSVMCMGTLEDELGTFSKLLQGYPRGILSVVSDTWDLWRVLTDYLPKLKDQVLTREGKLVIRPDSGDPVDIICGSTNHGFGGKIGDKRRDVSNNFNYITTAQDKGVIELLWDTFGGKVNEHGYKELDPHIGAIYGDSITLERAKAICDRLKAKGFASTNIVFGVGSYTYQHNTRDTFGFAVKATYGEIKQCGEHDIDYPENRTLRVAREIFKAPVTDTGEKKSAKGLLKVEKVPSKEGSEDLAGQLYLVQRVTPEQEKGGMLETVFLDGKLVKFQTLNEIRQRLKSQ